MIRSLRVIVPVAFTAFLHEGRVQGDVSVARDVRPVARPLMPSHSRTDPLADLRGPAQPRPSRPSLYEPANPNLIRVTQPSGASKASELIKKNFETFFLHGDPAINEPPPLNTGVPIRVPIGGGPHALPSLRARHLEAVRRLCGGSAENCSADSPNYQCTGTIVVHPNLGTGFVTAAHCLYKIRRDTDADRFEEQWDRVVIEGVADLATGTARISKAFANCAGRGVSYAACGLGNTPDVAFLPLSLLRDVVPWRVCTAPPTEFDWSIMGYGRDETNRPSKILRRGDFHGNGPLANGILRVRNTLDAAAQFGDSGGPTITRHDDEDLRSKVPDLCFVLIGGSGDSSRVPPTTNAGDTILQTIWNLDPLL